MCLYTRKELFDVEIVDMKYRDSKIMSNSMSLMYMYL